MNSETRKGAPAAWDARFAARSPMFAPLVALAQELAGDDWPDCAALNALAAARGVVNAAGQSLRFVPQAARSARFEDGYEPRIFLRGEVQTRSGNWHDCFNALVWLAFPRTKAALNARHYAAQRARRAAPQANRGAAQDALTLFDESGVVVACAAPALGALLREHAWQALFWQRRADLPGALAFHLFGHALYEKALAPYRGMTGRGLFVEVETDFFRQSAAVQCATLDALLAAQIGDPARLVTTGQLVAVPLLGVPGWCADNARADYYEDAGYFRPLRGR